MNTIITPPEKPPAKSAATIPAKPPEKMTPKEPAKAPEKPPAKSSPKEEAVKCSRCGSTNVIVVRQLPGTYYPGTLPDGKSYTAVRRDVYECRECGQQMAIMTHE